MKTEKFSLSLSPYCFLLSGINAFYWILQRATLGYVLTKPLILMKVRTPSFEHAWAKTSTVEVNETKQVSY